MVLMAGAKLATDNVFRLELANGSRVLALPGTESSVRGLTVDAWIVADEAARTGSRHYGGITSDADPASQRAFRDVVDGMEPHGSILVGVGKRRSVWMRIRATIDVEPNLIAPKVLERARRQLSARMISSASTWASRPARK